ncbi:MAG: hypothetical protein HYU29_05555 [Chloroflexi bacterium]|nr:hypothetical protein [Chloroflexota bacterium]
MSAVIPLLTALVSLAFFATVVDQYLERRKAYQLAWAAGLLLYCIASLMQGLRAFMGPEEVLFRIWYIAGALLVAAYLGMGTLFLLARPREPVPAPKSIMIPGALLVAAYLRMGTLFLLARPRIVMAVLAVLTVGSVVLGLTAHLRMDISLLEEREFVSSITLDPSVPAEQAALESLGLDPNEASEQSFFPISVRILAPILNTFGAVSLIGGALYSAWVSWRRRAPRQRAISNVLIAVGALVSAAGGSLERLGVPAPHTLALFIGVVIIYVGFLISREVFVAYRVPFLRRPTQAAGP